ncbi:hypothetical protein EYR36_009696 [Pleurotus pulmonarius]|nr:hypothetical protein EYR36_009696 [Pleurotus pulmonarius]
MSLTGSRESLFPATSIARLPRTPSHESLTAHPLLAPSSPQDPGATPTISSPYVPYTPRQRVSPSSTATNATVHQSVTASPPHQFQGDATSRLQLMNLKAATQNIGLDSTSIGWAMLDKLVTEGDQGAEWTEIWNALTVGKATLLLPTEHISAHDKCTAAFIKDHIVYSDETPRGPTPLVTLSGLRGYMEHGETLVFRSSLHPSTKHFHDITVPSTRSNSFASLPPLPNHLALSSPSPYPTFTISAQTSNVPLPPRASLSKPPLPPRPQSRANAPASVSRLSNPFASLFGHKQPPSPNPSTTTTAAQTSPTSSDAADHVCEITAFAINRKIVSKDVGREINRALRAEIKESLAGLPTSVTDRVHEFSSDFYPLVKASKFSANKKPFKTTETGSPGFPGQSPAASSSSVLIINPILESPEDLSERFQDFYASVEEDLRGGSTPFLSRKRDDQPPGEDVVTQKIDSDAKIAEIMETVERTICSLFYDRVFMQPTSDDASHDEALSGRVAALNMLDLGLEHLDIVVGDLASELNLVVKACGETLTQLDVACRSPGDKAAVLVAAHKVVVDGLSKLPPIRLKSQAESRTPSTLPTPIRDKPLSGLPITESPLAEPHEPSTAHTEPEGEPSSSTQGASPTILLTDADALSSVPVAAAVPLPDEEDSASAPQEEKEEKEKSALSDPQAEGDSDKPAPPALPPRTEPSRLSFSPEPRKEPTPVSGDVLLPMVIFSVVKANPPHLVSHLLFTQRFRNQSVGGEESYCLINLLAVAEFLENVDLAALGLNDVNKVMSTADLTPLPVPRSPSILTPPTPEATIARLEEIRGRVGQGVDAANKVINGVVDSSFTILRSIITNNPNSPLNINPSPINAIPSPIDEQHVSRPGFGLLRRQSSGFSLASIAASLPIPGARSKSVLEETGRPLLPVSRPSSVRSSHLKDRADDESSSMTSTSQGSDDETGEDGEEDEEGEEEEQGDGDQIVMGSGKREFDARSIRSFESMMSDRQKGRDRSGTGRKSLTDRLARVSGIVSLDNSYFLSSYYQDSSPSRRSSILPPSYTSGPHGSGPSSPVGSLRLAPPNQRFLQCAEGDLKISEVGDLLREYRRLANGIRAVGGFEE